jgi:putative Holliday junction resolvase
MPRILGLDPGERRIGVAVSDPTGTIASPIGYIDVTDADPVAAVRDLCAEHEARIVVVGLPVRLDGSEGDAAHRSRELGAKLQEVLGIDVRFWDERFTTVSAEKALLEGNVRRARRRTTRDQVAAALMLQGFLDRQGRDGGDGDDRRPDGG